MSSRSWRQGSSKSHELRKHLATTSQILNLQKCELDLLAGFLSHDLLVHRNFYRLPQDTLQLAKVSKILLAFDNGQIATYKGKTLDEICVEGDILEKMVIVTRYHPAMTLTVHHARENELEHQAKLLTVTLKWTLKWCNVAMLMRVHHFYQENELDHKTRLLTLILQIKEKS